MANREATVYVRVTKAEKSAMEKRAIACGLSITGWARSVLKFVSTGEGVPPGFDVALERVAEPPKKKRARR